MVQVNYVSSSNVGSNRRTITRSTGAMTIATTIGVGIAIRNDGVSSKQRIIQDIERIFAVIKQDFAAESTATTIPTSGTTRE